MESKPKYDFSKLRGRIKEKLGSEIEYAKRLEISRASISAKLNNVVYFSVSEIDKSVIILEIPPAEIYDYFFRKKVENNSTK